MLDPKKKEGIVKKFGTHASDTGSAQVQIAILSEEIKELQLHLKKHKHDFSSRRGLIGKVNTRRKLLRNLVSEDRAAFDKITDALNLKVAKKYAQVNAPHEALFVEDVHEEEVEAPVEAPAEEKEEIV
ncbi:MAG: 30S ribosomal protein S15 [bacterium]|nr:30S ribosomal protein S15 [bacterium]